MQAIKHFFSKKIALDLGRERPKESELTSSVNSASALRGKICDFAMSLFRFAPVASGGQGASPVEPDRQGAGAGSGSQIDWLFDGTPNRREFRKNPFLPGRTLEKQPPRRYCRWIL